MACFKWKCNRMIISPSHGWKKAFLILLYKISTLSPLTEVNLKPFVCASNDPLILFVTILGLMYKSFSFGLPLLCRRTNVSCFTRSSFSRSSASLVLNFFCTSFIKRKPVLRLEDGGDISPGSFVFVLRYVLQETRHGMRILSNRDTK